MKAGFEDRDGSRLTGITPPRAPIPVQILSVIFYAGFAISVSIVAMAMFGIIGVGLAFFFAWQWGRIPNLGGKIPLKEAIEHVRPVVTGDTPKSSGNKSFDAYKESLMQRLEQEQSSFEQFLDRLRASKDRTEFDQFMDARAMRTRDIRNGTAGQAEEVETGVVEDKKPPLGGTPLPA